MNISYSKTCAALLKAFGMHSALLILATAPLLAQPTNRVLEQPNLRLTVDRRSGVCPTEVELWAILLPLEGGADHIVVANTTRFASAAKVTRTTQELVEYEARLNPEYVSCIARATFAEVRPYSFQFRNGKVFFRVSGGSEGVKTTIVSSQLATGRPYVFWQARE